MTAEQVLNDITDSICKEEQVSSLDVNINDGFAFVRITGDNYETTKLIKVSNSPSSYDL